MKPVASLAALGLFFNWLNYAIGSSDNLNRAKTKCLKDTTNTQFGNW